MTEPDQNETSQTETRKQGVLLFNLGTPDAPERSAVGRYLKEFLSDERVVNLPRWFWLPLLYCVIVPIRSGRSAKAYAKVWTEEGSPLLVLSEGLTARLQQTDESRVFKLGMRYGKPSTREALEYLRDSGVEELTVLPMYPQFSYTTTASGYDAVEAALEEMNWNPVQTRINDFHLDTNWVNALAGKIRSFMESSGKPEKLIFSLHGIPQRYVDAGDPYRDQCEASTRAIADALGLSEDEWMLTFQSRLGREPWLQPYTDITLEKLGEEGVRHVQVVCPGFSVDCLETLEEIAMENAEIFEEAGGEKLEYIPALNDTQAHADALLEIIESPGRLYSGESDQ